MPAPVPVLAWCFDDERSELAAAVLRRVGEDGARSPLATLDDQLLDAASRLGVTAIEA